MPPESIPFSHLARAAYCPRQLYYAEKYDDHEPPAEVESVRELAFRYRELGDASADELASLPIDVSPASYRERLDSLAARDDWAELADPTTRDAFLSGRDCHGVAHKLLEVGDGPPIPTVVSPGTPPENGVWKPQRVRAVAAAKALAWEREREIPRALVEYPAHGIVRTVRLTTRNKGAYRRTLWTVRSTEGVPSRVENREKCRECAYRTRCGTKTRSLKTMLGL
ncbi:CRISPR-associated protein Cas4 [Halopelagius fulvigenes]|uniref:CRISPR-associated exonuclease Cas4 n=1 Tax=Halopelagius fulvigenes TaxID=1198324 RepID=A0ABD5U399_9EURY